MNDAFAKTYFPTGHSSFSALLCFLCWWPEESSFPKNAWLEYSAIPLLPVTRSSYPGLGVDTAGGEGEIHTAWIPSKASILQGELIKPTQVSLRISAYVLPLFLSIFLYLNMTKDLESDFSFHNKKMTMWSFRTDVQKYQTTPRYMFHTSVLKHCTEPSPRIFTKLIHVY